MNPVRNFKSNEYRDCNISRIVHSTVSNGVKIDCKVLGHKDLNEKIRQAINHNDEEITLTNVNGQRYIASGLKAKVKITIKGTPGNDLGSFMNGPEITVYGNGQDAIANTMNEGKIIIHGHAGDVLGYAMRGGKLYIKGNVGYRVGIHMKAYKHLLPVLIVGGSARDFLGEYMAGGILILLGLKHKKEPVVGNYVGTGMHGGIIYIREEIEKYRLGKEIGMGRWMSQDDNILRKYLLEYCQEFSLNYDFILKKKFSKLIPVSHRPYGKLYAY
ncbi:MAG: hypothetical protein ACE5IT_00440 [bacterium]